MFAVQALLLRRRFSSQRHGNSTSSSGTGGAFNTCSSTDSSIDANHIPHYVEAGGGRRYAAAGSSPLPRFAISPCGDQRSAAINTQQGSGYASGHGSDLSPVDEAGTSGIACSVRPSMEKRPSTVAHDTVRLCLPIRVSPDYTRRTLSVRVQSDWIEFETFYMYFILAS